jgi:hypothetical protein
MKERTIFSEFLVSEKQQRLPLGLFVQNLYNEVTCDLLLCMCHVLTILLSKKQNSLPENKEDQQPLMSLM